jgi:hypothetical protein
MSGERKKLFGYIDDNDGAFLDSLPKSPDDIKSIFEDNSGHTLLTKCVVENRY